MRIDKYLKVSRIIKRRTVACEACEQGKVSVNGKVAKPGTAVKEGDVLLHFSKETLDIAGKEAQATALTGESTYNDTMDQNSENQAKLTEATVNLDVLEQQITEKYRST